MERRDQVTPDFFCIGEARCRTTWLANCLDEHPGVVISRVKEPEFFSPRLGVFIIRDNPRFLADWDWYAELWSHAPDDRLRGDFSVNMMANGGDAADAVLQYAPNAKFLVSLRDPVQRIHSHYWNIKGRHGMWGGVPETFEEAIEDPTLLRRSLYMTELEPWLERFPRDQFCFLLDYELSADPHAELRRVFGFLGLDDSIVPSLATRPVRSARTRRGLYSRAVKVADRLRRLKLGGLVHAAKKARLARFMNRLDLKPYEYPPMGAKTYARLQETFEPEIAGIGRLLGKDLSPWRKPYAEYVKKGPPVRDASSRLVHTPARDMVRKRR